jgi:hypothetical protein
LLPQGVDFGQQGGYRRRFAHLDSWVGPLLAEVFGPAAVRFSVTLTVTEGPHGRPRLSPSCNA